MERSERRAVLTGAEPGWVAGFSPSTHTGGCLNVYHVVSVFSFHFTENILKTADLGLFIRHLFYLFFLNPDIPLVNFLPKVSQASFASIDSSFLLKSLPRILIYITIFGYDEYKIKERKGLNFSSVLFSFLKSSAGSNRVNQNKPNPWKIFNPFNIFVPLPGIQTPPRRYLHSIKVWTGPSRVSSASRTLTRPNCPSSPPSTHRWHQQTKVRLFWWKK